MNKLLTSFLVLLLFWHSSCQANEQVISLDQIKTVLLEIREKDQKFRSRVADAYEVGKQSVIDELWIQQAKLDTENQQYVAKILEGYGWPKQQDFKEEHFKYSQIMWLVLQHGPLEYQLNYLETAQLAYLNGDLQGPMFAMLQDRIRVNQGKPQLFGSQIHSDPDKDKPTFLPILDAKNVNKRRFKMSMESIEEYAKMNGVEYK